MIKFDKKSNQFKQDSGKLRTKNYKKIHLITINEYKLIIDHLTLKTDN